MFLMDELSGYVFRLEKSHPFFFVRYCISYPFYILTTRFCFHKFAESFFI